VLRRLLGLAGALVLVAGAVLIVLFLLALLGGELSAGGLLGAVVGAALVAGVLRLVPGDALLGGYSALVYVLLFAPILIVIVYAFNAGRQVQVWEGLSARWFGEALADEEIRSAIGRSLQIAVASALVSTALGTATGARAAARRAGARGVVRHRAVPRARRPRARAGHRGAHLLRQRGLRARGADDVPRPHDLQHRARDARGPRRAVSMGEGHEEASADLGAGPAGDLPPGHAAAAVPGDPRGLPARLHVLVRRRDHLLVHLGARQPDVAAAGAQRAALRAQPGGQRDGDDDARRDALSASGLGALVLRVSARRQGAQGVLGLSRGDVRPAAPVAAGG
jgi:hypothetical protein